VCQRPLRPCPVPPAGPNLRPPKLASLTSPLTNTIRLPGKPTEVSKVQCAGCALLSCLSCSLQPPPGAGQTHRDEVGQSASVFCVFAECLLQVPLSVFPLAHAPTKATHRGVKGAMCSAQLPALPPPPAGCWASSP
jgi:hypothetical protein